MCIQLIDLSARRNAQMGIGMNITHICLAGLFMDGWGYQDNLIAKYHVSFGYDVTVITNQWVYDHEGNYVKTDKETETDRYGVKIIRIPIKGDKPYTYKLKRYVGLYETLCKTEPEVIFLHSTQIMNVEDIIRSTKENPEIKVYADNHCDYSNSATNWLSKYILHGIIWKKKAWKLNPYVEKFYGVLPARVDFMTERYKLPKDRVELLVMGMDDEKAEEADKPKIKAEIRERFGYAQEDFVVITGGKIDHAKRQTLLLIEAVKRINNPHLKLLVFGSVVEDMKEPLKELCDSDERVRYIGWIQADETYPYFAAAQLAVFPGRHSVMWEQVAGQGVPMVVKYWEGTTHVDVGGNVEFLYNDSTEEIQEMLERLMTRGDEYQKMQKAAREKGSEVFSYRKISRRCIGE